MIDSIGYLLGLLFFPALIPLSAGIIQYIRSNRFADAYWAALSWRVLLPAFILLILTAFAQFVQQFS